MHEMCRSGVVFGVKLVVAKKKCYKLFRTSINVRSLKKNSQSGLMRLQSISQVIFKTVTLTVLYMTA